MGKYKLKICSDCGKSFEKLSKTGRCGLCGTKYTAEINKKAQIVMPLLKSMNEDQITRLVTYVEIQQKINPW